MQNEVITRIAEKDLERLNHYRTYLDFYTGQQWHGREKYSEKRLTFNYSRVFIDKLTSYLMAGMNFSVRSESLEKEAVEKAESARRALTRVYEFNSLEQLDFETEIDCAVLGDGCYKVVWDSALKNVRVTAPDISGIYAWWLGDDLSRTWRVASRYTLTAEEADLLYGIRSGNRTASLTEVWTDGAFELYLDNIPLEKKPNPYGFIPFIIFPDRMSQNL